MSKPVTVSRRQTLKALSGLPILPLAASLTSLPFMAEAASRHSRVRYEFGGMDAPSLADPALMGTTYVASTLTKIVGRHRAETYNLGYETFFLTGDTVPATGGGDIVAGGYYDIDNNPITDPTAGDRQIFSDCPDGMSLIQLKDRRGNCKKSRNGHNRIFAVVQFEYTSSNGDRSEDLYGKLPSPIAVLTLEQNPRTGKLDLVSYHNVDTSKANGLWITCGASLSPWNTHLSSEEYEPDATTINSNTQFQAFSQNLFGDPATAKPYHYGHLPEVTVHPDGTGTIEKHYCVGRISHELVQVMPDERTVLMGDDATNGGLFMFVADRRRKLSSGTLYVAKWHQTSAENGGSADITWIRLGHATSDEIKALADSLTAADIVDVQTSDPGDTSFTQIPYNGGFQWVKFQPGMEKAAAFLETHRYAAYMGGSMGFTKMEGTTVNVRDKVAYSAISDVKTQMTDGSGDVAIEGPRSGMVIAWKLRSHQKDDAGNWIHSEWVPTAGAPVPALIGEDIAADTLGNTSNPDKIGNPDNLKFSEKMRTLFIGEDSGRHINNFLWAYNVDTGDLARILSCPSGAESTGLHAVDDVNGFNYIMSNFQHPGEWNGLPAAVEDALNANYNDRFSAAVGYLTITGVKTS